MRLDKDFYSKDALDIAQDILGKKLIRNFGTKNKFSSVITEVEIYRGEEDLACHASKGRTKRTEIMYHKGGYLYVYLIYGMYWMLNVVTGSENNPQAVLIRGLEGYNGPGRLTNKLGIDKSFHGENILHSNRLWIENNHQPADFYTTARIGIDYAGELWINKPWRFVLKDK